MKTPYSARKWLWRTPLGIVSPFEFFYGSNPEIDKAFGKETNYQRGKICHEEISQPTPINKSAKPNISKRDMKNGERVKK